MDDTHVSGYRGFAHNPASRLESVFNRIHQEQMRSLPFSRPDLSPRAIGFHLYEDQWAGVMLTPWMLSLMILPGPDQIWPERAIGERVGLQLGRQGYTFVVGEHPDLGQYLFCSVQSPVTDLANQAQAEQVARALVNQAFSLAMVSQEPESVDPHKRAWIQGHAPGTESG